MHLQTKVQTLYSVGNTVHDCEEKCIQTIQYCLEMGGAHAERDHILLLQDCAEVCQTTAHMALRGSPHHVAIVEATVTIVEECAAACEKFAGDAHMKACANQCLVTASVLRQLELGTAGMQPPDHAGHAAGHKHAGQAHSK